MPLTVPAEDKLATVSLPLSCSVAPAATVTAAVSASRLAEPSTKVPLVTCTALASEVPAKVLTPVDVSAPAPSSALTVVLPPVSA